MVSRPSRHDHAIDERGQAVIEFALLAPVLLLILIGIFKCAIAFNNYLVLTDAVRAGARQLAVGRGTAAPCTAAVSRVRSAASVLDQANLAVTTTPASGSCTLTLGGDSSVAASYPCNLTIFGIDFFPSCTLTSKQTERVE